MNILGAVALCAVLSGVVFFMRSVDGGTSRILSLTLCIFMASAVYLSAKEPVGYIKDAVAATPLSGYTPYIMKSVAVCFVCKTCRDVCDTLGETAVSGQIDTAGKIAVLTLCLPLVKEVVSMALGYLN